MADTTFVLLSEDTAVYELLIFGNMHLQPKQNSEVRPTISADKTSILCGIYEENNKVQEGYNQVSFSSYCPYKKLFQSYDRR